MQKFGKYQNSEGCKPKQYAAPIAIVSVIIEKAKIDVRCLLRKAHK